MVNKIFEDVTKSTIRKEQIRIAIRLIYKYGCPYGEKHVDEECIKCWIKWFNEEVV